MQLLFMKLSGKIDHDELFAILSGRISMLINRYLYNKFREANLGITVEQWTILACLWKKDKVTQQALSETTFRDQPSITRLIDNLEKRNLVIRVPDPSDRRIKLIYLTEQGTALEKQSTDIVSDVVNKALSGILDEEVLVCRNTLKKVLENLA